MFFVFRQTQFQTVLSTVTQPICEQKPLHDLCLKDLTTSGINVTESSPEMQITENYLRHTCTTVTVTLIHCTCIKYVQNISNQHL